MKTVVDDATDLLQHLIRNACVNDGTVGSGHEDRSIDTLTAYLTAPGVEVVRYEPQPGRVSLVLRIEGTDAAAPSLHLCGHVDVVPVNPAGWQRDPFGGELVDGTVWGRGAIDMLDTTATMAVAVRRLIDSGFHPRGTLIYSAVADEEALGTWGAEWLIDHEWDAVKSDYLLTEFGGARFPLATAGGPKLPVMAGEKGSAWTRLRVKGTPGHGSMPLHADNAAVKAGVVLGRIAAYRPPPQIHDLWQRFVDGLGLSAPQRLALTHTATLDRAIGRLPRGVERMFSASTRTTFSPNIISSGIKINVIPDSATIDIDIRTLPGEDGAPVLRMLADAIGDLWSECEVVFQMSNQATTSPVETPLWDVLAKVTARLVPGAKTVPMILMGATDARFFRRKGVVAYGYGLLSDKIPFDQFSQMFHGNDERVDQESLRLSADLFEHVARELLGPA